MAVEALTVIPVDIDRWGICLATGSPTNERFGYLKELGVKLYDKIPWLVGGVMRWVVS